MRERSAEAVRLACAAAEGEAASVVAGEVLLCMVVLREAVGDRVSTADDDVDTLGEREIDGELVAERDGSGV